MVWRAGLWKKLICTFTHCWICRILFYKSGLSYFRILTICLLLVYFVSAAGCHYFDGIQGRCFNVILGMYKSVKSCMSVNGKFISTL